MEGEWGKFEILREEVEKLTKLLQKDTEKVKDISKKFEETLSEEEKTFKECADLGILCQSLTQAMTELGNVREKLASKDIVIEFVGTTNSGKSSVINALLRERRVPVGFMQTTMCSIRVRVTENREWSVEKIGKDGEKKLLSEAIEEKALENLLSKMSGLKNEKLRKEEGIDLYTTVQINWPKEKCRKLPENVILCDTPGFGESEEDIQLVTERCKKADIIVAVMDSTSPSREILIELVKDVGCLFTFGVFTKWDECLRKAEKEGDDTVKNVTETAEVFKKEFWEALQGKSKVYFVNVENFLEPNSSFQEFERTLATKATEIKGKSLTEQAKSIASRSLEYCDRLKKAIGKKKTEKLQRLGEELASAKKGSKTLHNPFESIKSEDEDLQVSTSDTYLLEEVNKKLSEGALEEHSVEFFLKKINEKTTKAIASKRDEISKAYQEWKKNTACRKFQSFNLRFREPPQLQYRELPKEEYNCLFDPHYYYTSNLLLPCTFGVVALASPAVALLVAVKAGGFQFLSTLACGGAAGGVGGIASLVTGIFRLGDKMKKKYPISPYKVKCWKRFLVKELKNHHENCKKMLREEKGANLKRLKEKLEIIVDENPVEIEELCSDSHFWNELGSRLGIIEDSIRATLEQLKELLANEDMGQSSAGSFFLKELYPSYSPESLQH